jgi:hypothetical protein
MRFTHISVEENMKYFGSYRYDGLEPMDFLLSWIQDILEYQRFHDLDTVLVGTPTRWWDAYHKPHREWVTWRLISVTDLDLEKSHLTL